MAKRNLCRRHFEQEFKGLTLVQELHADWQIVEPCEICAAERADLWAALEQCVKLLRKWEAHLEVNDPTLERVIEAIQQACAALGEEAGDEMS